MLVEEDLGFRKIQHTGRDSYIISLPKEWMSSVGLSKGDQLAFKIQEDSSLLLVPRKILEEKDDSHRSSMREFNVAITRRDDPQSISRRIVSLYEVGADLVRVSFREGEITSEQKTTIRNITRMLLGSEIIAESPREISIQILVEQSKFPVEKAIRRMFAVASAMDQDVTSVLKGLNEDLINGAIDSNDDLDRLNLYVVRQLKYGIEHNLFKEMEFRSSKEFLGYRIVAKNLKNIGDNSVGTAREILSLKKLVAGPLFSTAPIDEEVFQSVHGFHSFCHQMLEDSLKALFKRDYHLADEVMSQCISTGSQRQKDAVNLLLSKRIDQNITYILRLILENSSKMMEYSRDIAEVTLNRTVEELAD